jgi:hypothetical protein
MGHGTCMDCNKKFCLDYNLPICKDAMEDDVFTTCFRKTTEPVVPRIPVTDDVITERDSAKDEAVVFIFIFATVGLLLYAAIRPCVEKWMEVSWILFSVGCIANLLIEYEGTTELCTDI